MAVSVVQVSFSTYMTTSRYAIRPYDLMVLRCGAENEVLGFIFRMLPYRKQRIKLMASLWDVHYLLV